MITDWDAPFQLQSQYGNLDLNTATGDRYILNRAECDSGADIRSTIDNIPSGDGGITHDVFSSWYAVQMSASLWVDGNPACDGDLTRMVDALSLVVLGMRHADGRIFYTPSGHAQRLLDDVRLTTRITHQISNEGRQGQGEGRMSVVTWGMASPFPYTIVAAQTVTHVNNGATFTFVNAGSTEFFPVVKVYGPTLGGFIITNSTTGKRLVYDPSLPGASDIPGGHFIELDFFRNTAYLDGDQANEKKGIDITLSDFFPITPAALGNVIGITGAGMDVLWQSAFG